jgi:hypothetical protein
MYRLHGTRYDRGLTRGIQDARDAGTEIGFPLVLQARALVGPEVREHFILRHERQCPGARFLDFDNVDPSPASRRGGSAARKI